MNRYEAIGQSYLDNYNITLNVNSDCWKRPHAHADTRTICKMPLPRGRRSLFDFLHEVGHIVHPLGAKGLRAQVEHYATTWAIAEMRKLGIPVSRKQMVEYREYIETALARAKRRGLKTIPSDVKKYDDPSYKPVRHSHTWRRAANGNGSTCDSCGMWTSEVKYK